jgi:hypothetical protein
VPYLSATRPGWGCLSRLTSHLATRRLVLRAPRRIDARIEWFSLEGSVRKSTVPLAIFPILFMAASTTHRPVVDAAVTVGSTIGFRAADHNNYGVNNDAGMVNWSAEFAPPASPGGPTSNVGVGQLSHQKMREAGVGWVRYWLSWQSVEGSNLSYNWQQPDHDINAALEQGMNVVITIHSAPQWLYPIGNGFNRETYEWGQCDGPGPGADFDSTKPFCGPAGSPNAYAPFDSGHNVNSVIWKRFVTAAVQRYGKKVKHWSFWNESGNPWMWPEWPEAPAFNRMEQLVRKVIKPGRDAALAANPSVVIVGPDDNDPNNLAGVLNLEASGAYGRLFDIISIHAYNEAGSSTATKLNQFKAVLDNYHRREVWLTETQSSQDAVASNMEEFFVRGWVSKLFLFTMRDTGACGFNHTVMLDYARNPCYGHSLLAYHTWDQGQPAMHFAGTTGVSGHNDFVLLQNPHAYTAGVNVRFSKNGVAPITQFYSLPPRSRATVHVASSGHANADQAVSVMPTTAYLPVFAEHADYWAGGNAGRLSQGSGERSDTWYFAEGAFAGGYFLHENTVFNPSRDFSVTITWKFLNTSGSTVSVSQTIGPLGSYKLNVNGVAGVEPEHGTVVSGKWANGPWINLHAPIIAERTMSWGGIEGHSARGVPFPSTQWYFAEGSQNGSWSTYLPIVNPTSSLATVHITYLTPGGPNGPYGYNINPNSRITVAPPALGDFGVIVKSVGGNPVPVVVERAMYQGAGWTVGTITEGATSPSQRWLLPEGSTEGGNYYQPFFLLANPSNTAATVQLRFQLPGGGAPFVPASITVPAQSRVTVNPWSYVQLQNTAFSTEVVVTDSIPSSDVAPGIIVERSMYWGGLLGGHSGLGIY